MIFIAVAHLGRTQDLQRSLEEALAGLRDLKSERSGDHLTLHFSEFVQCL